MRYRSKRGSLQLSINAIVILILAITLLGLGLGFIKKQFGTVTAKFEEASQDIENEVIDKIKSSGEILAFDKIRLIAERGKPQQFYIGVKNTDGANPRCYKFKFLCTQSLSSDTCDNSPLVVGGGVTVDEGGEGWFTTFKGMAIEPLDVQVAPVKLQVEILQDSYNMRVKLYQSTEECEDPSQASGWLELTSKQFFLEVK